jgi:very-short-patch-repair endonuclease
VKHDKERDAKLNQAGWTIIRFTEIEIEHQSQQMMSKIVKTIMQKEMMVKEQAPDQTKQQ